MKRKRKIKTVLQFLFLQGERMGVWGERGRVKIKTWAMKRMFKLCTQNVYNILVTSVFENLQGADYVGVYIVKVECVR